MAGDWIKMRTSLLKAPQVIRLAGDLNRSKLEILGALFTIWTIADESSLEGNIKLGPKHLDAEMGLPGFAEAMAAVGWLEVVDANAIRLTNYGEHNGKTGKRRAEDYQRAKDLRAKEKAKEKADKKAKLNGTGVQTGGTKGDRKGTDCGQIADELPTDCGRNVDEVWTKSGQKVTAFQLEKEEEKEKEKEKEKEIDTLDPFGVFSESEEKDPAEQAANLTRTWVNKRLGGCRSEREASVLEAFSDALRTGMDYRKAMADLVCKNRRRSEYAWAFMERNHPRVRPNAINSTVEATIQRMSEDPEKARLLEVAFNGYGN